MSNNSNNRKFVAGLGLAAAVTLIVLTLSGAKQAAPTIHKEEAITVDTATVSQPQAGSNPVNSGGNIEMAHKAINKITVSTNRVVYFNNAFTFSTVQDAVEQLKKLEAEDGKTPIYLLLDSPGGSVLDGATLISQMEASKAPVYTVCMRLCASMAAMTHSYGAKRYALDRAILMYHPASLGAQGQLNNMISLLGTLQRFIDKMNANIVSRSKLAKDDYERKIAYEFWVDSEDALKYGLVDGIISLSVPNKAPNQSSGGDDSVKKSNTNEVKFPTKTKVEQFEMRIN